MNVFFFPSSCVLYNIVLAVEYKWYPSEPLSCSFSACAFTHIRTFSTRICLVLTSPSNSFLFIQKWTIFCIMKAKVSPVLNCFWGWSRFYFIFFCCFLFVVCKDCVYKYGLCFQFWWKHYLWLENRMMSVCGLWWWYWVITVNVFHTVKRRRYRSRRMQEK